jgi:GxxExxY protein
VGLLYEEESYAILGACCEVYKEMGCGFVEPVYQEAMAIELMDRLVPFREQMGLAITCKGRRLIKTYEPDFVCHEKIIVELKAVTKLTDAFRAQTHNSLRASGLRLGLLVNFGHHPKLEYERIVR